MANPISFDKFVDYFRYFKEKKHQLDGLKDLYIQLQAKAPELLLDDAKWQFLFSNPPVEEPVSGTSVILTVPYQQQLDNASGRGDRECFSSSCAMLAMYYKKVKNDDEYNKVRAKYGDTTNPDAQVKALKSLGINCEFRTDGTVENIERLIREKKPVPVGWLHHGTAANPVGGGHWTLICGFDSNAFIHNDPYGECDMVNGGYLNHTKGNRVNYSRKNWIPRWRVRGTGGWYIKVL
jgi:hypothetical protein